MLPSIDLFGYTIEVFAVLLLSGIVVSNWIFVRYVRKTFIINERQLISIQAILVIAFVAGGWLGNAIMYAFMGHGPLDGYSIMGSVLLIAAVTPLAAYVTGLRGHGRELTDIVSVAFLPAQMIGKVACLAAGCCYGTECSSHFGVEYPMNSGAPVGISLHAVQLYEAFGLLLLWLICRRMLQGNYAAGLVTGVFLVGKGVERFLAEFLRGDVVATDIGISTAQLASLACIAGGVIYILLRRRDVAEISISTGGSPAAQVVHNGLHYSEADKAR